MFQAPPNPLMPGVVWDVKEKRVRVFQTLDDTLALHELKNFTIIRDPSTPFPAGRAYCLPAYHVIGAIDHANKAAERLLFRVGHSVLTSDQGRIIATVFDEEQLYSITQADVEVR